MLNTTNRKTIHRVTRVRFHERDRLGPVYRTKVVWEVRDENGQPLQSFTLLRQARNWYRDAVLVSDGVHQTR